MVKKMLTYSENPTLLWLTLSSLLAGVLAVGGYFVTSFILQVLMLGLAVLILSVNIGVFTVAILAPNVANMVKGEEIQPDYKLPMDKRIEE